MNKPIRMAFPQKLGVRKYDTGAFTVIPSTLVQRLVWRFLCWTGAVTAYWDEEMIVREVVIDPDKVVLLLVAEARGQLLRLGYKPTTVYIGPEEFVKAHKADAQYLRSAPPFSFNAQAERFTLEGKYEIFSFEVKVLPYMKGILVV